MVFLVTNREIKIDNYKISLYDGILELKIIKNQGRAVEKFQYHYEISPKLKKLKGQQSS